MPPFPLENNPFLLSSEALDGVVWSDTLLLSWFSVGVRAKAAPFPLVGLCDQPSLHVARAAYRAALSQLQIPHFSLKIKMGDGSARGAHPWGFPTVMAIGRRRDSCSPTKEYW